ncbi:hypothetical protein [Nannocystis sp. SCPEA4]|uniref:hypothetical protein n=1 Tax=Nannocystis sp. SCPEA4 TaxID=2996787 RepID=UPI00226F231C|nr:hypothetical protein [Nannocystis sp. SCPEA4]MCY1055597.1 hypothetical protein [Nannocystis sp. SCPEA4]
MHHAIIVASLALSLATAPEAAESAITPRAGVDAPDPCGSILTRLSQVSEGRGYRINVNASELIGTRGPTQLQAHCSAGLAEIALRDVSGAAVSVSFGRRGGDGFALEVVGEYPQIGTVSRAAIVDDASADPLGGSLTFAADVGAGLVFVEFDLAGEVLAAGGDASGDDARRVNNVFAPTLNTSAIWKDAHVLGYAAAGAWNADMALHEAELDMILGLAIPSPDPVAKVDSDSKDAVQKCGTAFVLSLGALWFPPAAVAGAAWLVSCAFALPCLPKDCAGDGV